MKTPLFQEASPLDKSKQFFKYILNTLLFARCIHRFPSCGRRGDDLTMKGKQNFRIIGLPEIPILSVNYDEFTLLLLAIGQIQKISIRMTSDQINTKYDTWHSGWPLILLGSWVKQHFCKPIQTVQLLGENKHIQIESTTLTWTSWKQRGQTCKNTSSIWSLTSMLFGSFVNRWWDTVDKCIYIVGSSLFGTLGYLMLSPTIGQNMAKDCT